MTASQTPALFAGPSEDGYVYLAGRKKDMIGRGGENIFPIEIESVLMLAPYKVPVEFHFVDELPKNASGKVFKRVLREGDGAPE